MTQANADPEAATADPSVTLEADETQYLLHSRIDIAYVLRDMVRTRTLSTVHFGAARETLLTALLEVDSAAAEIVFDASASEEVNRSIVRAHKLFFFSSQEKVKVRFTTGPARMVERQGRQAFAVSFPEEMLRLQRRELYRVLAPVARPVRCIVPINQQDGYRYSEARLHDISQGGVALIAAPGEASFELGVHYPNCRIVLPEVGNVVVTLATVFMVEITLLNAKTALRVGCQFVRPSMSALALVQRYMMRLERDNKARA